jgi:hypothetical protein
MQVTGWRADEPAFGLWSSSRDSFIVICGNNRTAAWQIAGVSSQTFVKSACMRAIKTNHPEPENDPSFLLSVVLAIQASDPTPRDFTYTECSNTKTEIGKRAPTRATKLYDRER